jgi:Rft protein
MNIGVYLTWTLGLLVTGLYGRLYGDKHPYFTTAVALYSVGSLCSAYCSRLNVDPQLQFDFAPSAYSEAVSLSANNFIQVFMIALWGADPILSFGFAMFCSGIIQVFCILALFYSHNASCAAGNKYRLSLALQSFEYQGKRLYLLPGTIEFSASLAYTALINDFLDQTYFVVFASGENFLGELTLIRGFGSIFVRFLYMPVNEVTYNLYAKLYSQFKLQKLSDSKDDSDFRTILSILKILIWMYTTLCLFLLVYGASNSFSALTILFGSKWVNPVISEPSLRNSAKPS